MTIEQLARLAEQFVNEMGLPLKRTSRGETIQPRTIRYYASEKVIDPPLETRALSGTYNLYGYRHLLQMLAARRLQTRDFSIRQIQAITRGLANEELERLCRGESLSSRLGTLVAEAAEEDQMPLFASIVAEAAPPPMPQALASPRLSGERKKSSAASGPPSWNRIAIHDGLELHIRSDLQVTRQEEARILGSLIETVRRSLRSPARTE